MAEGDTLPCPVCDSTWGYAIVVVPGGDDRARCTNCGALLGIVLDVDLDSEGTES